MPTNSPSSPIAFAYTFDVLNFKSRPSEMIARRSLAPIRCFTRGSLMSLCLLMFVACDARSAFATCGDYLHGHGTPMPNHNGLNAPFSDHQVPMPGPRCTGPQCQQNQQKPAAPTKTVQIQISTDAILTTVSALSDADDFCGYQSADSDPIEGFVCRVFRPPRAA